MSEKTVRIYDGLCERYAAQLEGDPEREDIFTLLLGASSGTALTLSDVVVAGAEPSVELIDSLRLHLPAGIDVLGCFYVSAAPAHAPVPCDFDLELNGAVEAGVFREKDRLTSMVPGSTLIGRAELLADTLSLSLRFTEDLYLPPDSDGSAEAAELDRLRESVFGEPGLVFRCAATGALVDEEAEGTLADHLAQGGKRRPTYQFTKSEVKFEALQRTTGLDLVESVNHSVPVISRHKVSGVVYRTPVELHVLAVVPSATNLADIPDILQSALAKELDSLQISIGANSSHLPRAMRSCLYQPYPLPYFVQVQQPAKASDEELQHQRAQLHRIFGLSLRQPFFRSGNGFSFDGGAYLRNVHEALGPSGVSGTVSIVPGRYDYRHYMQDGVDDNGWGCAYRSFQTLWSWLQLQGLTERAPPTHREIQQALVEIGDKEPAFVGSRQWVGSLELSFVLSHLLDMESRILTAASGEEMAEKARELGHHFATQGTPVMIGGGVLAHTIIGVDFNEDSGDVKFLVLDPHYTGDENVKTIIDKGWVGWKGVKFWQKEAFFNMLLPIKPAMY